MQTDRLSTKQHRTPMGFISTPEARKRARPREGRAEITREGVKPERKGDRCFADHRNDHCEHKARTLSVALRPDCAMAHVSMPCSDDCPRRGICAVAVWVATESTRLPSMLYDEVFQGRYECIVVCNDVARRWCRWCPSVKARLVQPRVLWDFLARRAGTYSGSLAIRVQSCDATNLTIVIRKLLRIRRE
jgi:hypothetical protein